MRKQPGQKELSCNVTSNNNLQKVKKYQRCTTLDFLDRHLLCFILLYFIVVFVNEIFFKDGSFWTGEAVPRAQQSTPTLIPSPQASSLSFTNPLSIPSQPLFAREVLGINVSYPQKPLPWQFVRHSHATCPFSLKRSNLSPPRLICSSLSARDPLFC